MIVIFMIILIVVGIFAVWFNYWNHKNPVGSKKNNQVYSMENLQQINKQNNLQYKEQNERVLKMFNDKGSA